MITINKIHFGDCLKNFPKIPNKFPCLEVSGDDNPLRAKINNTPDIR